MKFQMKRLMALGLILTAVSVLAACGGGSKPAVPAPESSKPATAPAPGPKSNVPKDELKVAMGSLPPVLDPYQYFTPPNIIPYYALYDAPTVIDVKDGAKVKPNLATEWKQTSDTTWEFKLKPGIKFANGEDADAAAVKFAVDYLLDPANKLPVLTRINTIKSVTVMDKYTFRVDTTAVDPLLPARMAVVFVLPPKAFAAAKPADFFQNPIGTGPYKVAQFVKDDKLVLEANPSSWHGTSALKKITLQVMPEAAARLAALKAGDVDMVHKLPTDQADAMKKAGFNIVSATEAGTYIIDVFKKTGPLADKRVRQALNYAINKEGLVKEIMGGYGTLSEGQLVNPGLSGYSADVKAYPYDPNKAKQLLAEAGYGNGLNLSMEISNGYILNDKQLGEAIAAMLGEVGVKVNVKVSEYSLYLQTWSAPPDKRPDLFAWRLTLNPFLDADASMQYFTTGFKVHPIGFSNPQFDTFYQNARKTVDPAARQKLLGQAAAVLREDAPVIFVMHTPDIWAVHPALKGVSVGPDGVTHFDQFSKDQ